MIRFRARAKPKHREEGFRHILRWFDKHLK